MSQQQNTEQNNEADENNFFEKLRNFKYFAILCPTR
jgi:hypothetical protein